MNGSHARAETRVRMLLIVGLLTALALGSFWAREIMRRGINESLPEKARDEPDYFVEKFVFVKMSPTGNVRYDISGTRLTHLPRSDSYEIEKPVLRSRSNPQSPLTMRAEKATVDDGNSRVLMQGGVQVERPKSAEAEHFLLNTERLLILPDDDRMQTDLAVDLALGQSNMTGIGMSLDNSIREFRLLKQSHVSYVMVSGTEPPSRTPSQAQRQTTVR
jgi:lipopolysaccharide export system protein LptC